jgi:predicted AlkP superfamily phosphohydrolase/phosphomutase
MLLIKKLIKRAKDFFKKDTSIETMYPLRPEYKEFKNEYFDPYMKKMKEYQDETEKKLEEENTNLSKYKETDKPEERKKLTADQKKKLTKKLENSTESVKKLGEFLEKIKNFSGLK